MRSGVRKQMSAMVIFWTAGGASGLNSASWCVAARDFCLVHAITDRDDSPAAECQACN